MRVVGTISGGTGSYAASRRYIDKNGMDNMVFLFTDTLAEDQDAYRFLIASVAELTGRARPQLPAIHDFPKWEDRDEYKAFVLSLREEVQHLLPEFVWLTDGRDPWDVYEGERFLGNSQRDPCSKVLKRKALDTWLDLHCFRGYTRIVFGIDLEEKHRFDDGKGHGIRPRREAEGWEAVAPLCDLPILSWRRHLEKLSRSGLWLPRLNELGFAHNNCGGFCCKAGMGHWRKMLTVFPERYAYAEYRETLIRQKLGDVAMLTERKYGVKRPLPLSELRGRTLSAEDAADMGACHCFLGD